MRNESTKTTIETKTDLVELTDAELEATNGGLYDAVYGNGGDSCIFVTAPDLGGWSAFEYCTAKFFGII